MILLFGYVIVGYCCNKLHIFDEMTNGKLSAFLVKVAMPATILASAFRQEGLELSMIAQAMAMSMGIYVFYILMSKMLAKLFHWENTVELMLTYSNIMFMGLPIVRSLYGEAAVFYVVIFVMAFNLWFYTLGIQTLHRGTTQSGTMWKKMLNPGIVAALLAVVIVCLDLPAPDMAVNLLEGVGSVTTPLAMMIIGSQVALVDIKKVITRWDLYGIAACKLVLYPVVVHLLCRSIMGDGLYTNVATVLAAMPTAGNVTMLCSEYDGNTSLAAQGTCIATTLSAVTLPVLMYILGR